MRSPGVCSRQVWARAAGVGEGVWRPDPRDPVDAWLVAAAAVCRTLRREVEERYGYHLSALYPPEPEPQPQPQPLP